MTQLLQSWRSGDGRAFNAVIESAHTELQKMAEERMRGNGQMTLTSHDVLNEAVVRLLESPVDLSSRSHFFATMSLAMRAVVVDHARARSAAKRGGGDVRITYTDALGGADQDVFDLLALDQALQQLAESDPRGADVLHLTYFAGMSQEEISALLGVSLRTIERDMRFLRAWLNDQLSHG